MSISAATEPDSVIRGTTFRHPLTTRDPSTRGNCPAKGTAGRATAPTSTRDGTVARLSGDGETSAAVRVYASTEYHAKNATALDRFRTEFKGKVAMLPLPVPVLRALKKLAAEVVKEGSEKTPMARKVHASFTKFQALVGRWDHVAEGAYHQLVAG